MPSNVVIAHVGYIVSVLCFMLGIMRMGRVASAASGNRLAALAMLIAVIAQLIELGAIDYTWIILGLVIGTAIGWWLAVRVQMTEMPQMVALLNGFGGLASTLVALAMYFGYVARADVTALNMTTIANVVEWGPHAPGGSMSAIALMLTIAIGSLTFSGSLVAWAKLSGRMPGQPLLYPWRHKANAALFACTLLITVLMTWTVDGIAIGVLLMLGVTLVTLALGVGLTIPIGGGDMPVVISLLNSYSGMAAACAGFALNSPVLIVSGTLVGASGLILTRIMCRAMNRDLMKVLFGGFGANVEAAAASAGTTDTYAQVRVADPEEAALSCSDARSVIIVPGYGLAVAQAQHALRELADLLAARGANVRYAIHPVAGRMPGHMNVLLAEANVPYEQLFEMERINADFRTTDVVLVVGANDVVNPAARSNPQSPIYGMPILDVDHARMVLVIKRSLAPGFSGIKNELFEKNNVAMVYGDARPVLEALTRAIKELSPQAR